MHCKLKFQFTGKYFFKIISQISNVILLPSGELCWHKGALIRLSANWKILHIYLHVFPFWVPVLICFQFEEGKKKKKTEKLCGLITHIGIVVVSLQLLGWGEPILNKQRNKIAILTLLCNRERGSRVCFLSPSYSPLCFVSLTFSVLSLQAYHFLPHFVVVKLSGSYFATLWW